MIVQLPGLLLVIEPGEGIGLGQPPRAKQGEVQGLVSAPGLEWKDQKPSMTSLTRLKNVVFSFATEDISHDMKHHVVPRLIV